jgi:phasin family protein
MFAIPAQFAEVQKSQADTAYAIADALIGAAEKLTNLNIAAARAIVSESAEDAESYYGVKDLQALFTLNAGFAQPALEKFASYNRNLYSIVSAAGADISKIVETRIADANRAVGQMVEFASKNAPAGSESAVSIIKNVVAASNEAYDTFSRAAKQAVSAAEANVGVATQSVLNSASAANEAVRNVAKKAA